RTALPVPRLLDRAPVRVLGGVDPRSQLDPGGGRRPPPAETRSPVPLAAREALPRRDPRRRGTLRSGARPPRLPVLAGRGPRALLLARRAPSRAAFRMDVGMDRRRPRGPRVLLQAGDRDRGDRRPRGVFTRAAAGRARVARTSPRGLRRRRRV